MLMMHKQPGACIPYRHPDWAVAPERPGSIHGITVEKVLVETGRAFPRGDVLSA
jgi:hypothetical protein